MKADRIEVGMILKLKKEIFESSCHADGSPLESDLCKVTEIRYRDDYKVPFIICGNDAMRPSDFSHLVEYAL